ncbi:MAG: nitroreductase family protein [Myxococcales bacterium]|nr:nitroreductase family protein [Myxococcales bacterium]
MELFEALFDRRSIRRFAPGEVSDEAVEKMLRAAMYAPSAGNQRPWHFVVLRERRLLNAVPGFHPHARMLSEAALAVLVCADLALETHRGYWMVDCAAATQNLLLAAHGLSLGAVWLGIFPRPERMKGMRELLRLPENIQPFALVAVGRAAEHPPRPERFLTERIHRDGW